MLLLGEFNNLTAASGESAFETWLVMSMFLLATLFTQVAMLNMLIALMSDIFENLMEAYRVHQRRSNLHFLNMTSKPLLQLNDEMWLVNATNSLITIKCDLT